MRGGGELGRRLVAAGPAAAQEDTFTDFLACAQHLVVDRRPSPDRLAARGLSAGGLLMGAVAHLAPEQFAVVVAEVPFVDVVATMLDDTLPLTVAEWEEWGDPRACPSTTPTCAATRRTTTCPGRGDPRLLVTASRNDPRVSVHEPAKWVARMRADEETAPAERDDPPLLLRTAIGGGAHTGPAGRYDAWAHEAFLHAVTLDRLGAG